MKILDRPSPNHNARPDGQAVDILRTRGGLEKPLLPVGNGHGRLLLIKPGSGKPIGQLPDIHLPLPAMFF